LPVVKIRLQRFGKKHQPTYRIVVIDSRRQRDGKVLDTLGHYDPLHKDSFALNVERLQFWLARGAQMSARVKSIRKLQERPRMPESQESEPIEEAPQVTETAVSEAEPVEPEPASETAVSEEEPTQDAGEEETEPSEPESKEGEETAEAHTDDAEEPEETAADETDPDKEEV
jgi:small subunit ribosomal protein S16